MTRQEVFNTAVLGVIKQGALCSCAYRHPELPLKCAVGHLVDDETAELWAETSIEYLFEVEHPTIPSHLRDHGNLLDKLQSAHDFATDLNDFVLRATKVAYQFHLEMPHVV